MQGGIGQQVAVQPLKVGDEIFPLRLLIAEMRKRRQVARFLVLDEGVVVVRVLLVLSLQEPLQKIELLVE